MAKTSVRYVCTNCGAISSAWAGRCAVCGSWNTLQEELAITSDTVSKGGHLLQTDAIGAVAKAETFKRMQTGIKEIDLVFGGGIVNGSVTLIAGEPGIGKSTLLMQLSEAEAKTHAVLYVSGEESAHQVDSRAE